MTVRTLPWTAAATPRDSEVARDTTVNAGLLPAALLIVGLMFPTSIGTSISTTLVTVQRVIFCAAAFWIGIRYGAFGSVLQLWTAAFIILWCAAASMVSPFADLALGAGTIYLAMAFLFSLNARRLQGAALVVVFRIMTIAVLAVATAILAANDWVLRRLQESYAFGYPELVPWMLALRKPVFTFASHSLAGFFYFLLFYVNLEAYRLRRHSVDLLLALLCILAGTALASTTAIVLMSTALVLFFFHSGPFRWPVFGVLVLVLVVAITTFQSEIANFITISNLASVLDRAESGLSGRFGRGGNLLNTVEFLLAQPFRPVGLTESLSIFYGDSGPLEYLLRGSLPLLIAVYSGFGLFVFRSLRARRHAFVLFAVTLAFEVGMTVLAYPRFLYFLIFAIIYLNALVRSADQDVRSGRSAAPLVEDPA